MNFRKSRNLMWIGFAVGILIMALGIGFENEKVTVGFMAAGIIVFAIAALQAFIFYVCPYCVNFQMPASEVSLKDGMSHALQMSTGYVFSFFA